MRRVQACLLGFAALAVSTTAWSQTSSSGFTIGLRYDAEGRLTGTIAPDPDEGGVLKHAAVRNVYDAAGRLVQVEKGELATWQPETVEPKNWPETEFKIFSRLEATYDNLNRKLVERAWASGEYYAATQYSYDALGRLECTAIRMNKALFASLSEEACDLGPEGSEGPDRITRNRYDAAGQLVQIRNAVGVPGREQAYATYGYTPNGKLEYVVDANGNKARLLYDGHDRQTQWRFPSSATPPAAFDDSTPKKALDSSGAVSPDDREEYRHDANGNRTWLRKRDGAVLEYQYDSLNRLTHKRVPNPTVGAAASPTANCHVGSALAIASDSNDVCYDYDLRGLQTGARFGWEAGPGVGSAYDGFGRLASSSTTMGGTSRAIAYQYDANGNRIRVTHPDSETYFVYHYDGLDRLITVREKDRAEVASITWNAKGQRLGEARGAVGISYEYDPASRLQSIFDDLVGSGNDVRMSFGYNPANQIVSRTLSNDAYRVTHYRNTRLDYTTNGLNQYSNAVDDRYTYDFDYDANGNLIASDVAIAGQAPDPGLHISYSYDAENRLLSSSRGAPATPAARLVYDPLGRLFETSFEEGGVTRFAYDGDQLTLEYGVGGDVLRRYVHGNGEDDPLLWYEGATLSDRRSLQTNHQGSVVSVAEASGAAIEINSYDEYGIPGGRNIGRYQYTGQAWIPELGMYYYKARIYSPTLGRFLQTDPIGYDSNVNLYTYASNDPVNRSDPTGLQDASEAEIARARAEAVRKAWAQERALVRAGKPGTVDWTPAQRQQLIKEGQVSGYVGHHENTVKGNPIEMARNPDNIRFMTREDHVALHRANGGTRVPISGKPLGTRSARVAALGGRSLGVFGWLSSLTGLFSGRVRSDSFLNFSYDMLGLPSPEDQRNAIKQRCAAFKPTDAQINAGFICA